MRIRAEERIASLLASAGIIWAAQIASASYSHMPAMAFPPGPLELCSVAVVVWLHAKWRRSMRAS